MIDKEKYKGEFSTTYNKATEKTYGSAELSLLERKTLKEMRIAEEALILERIYGHTDKQLLEPSQREELRLLTWKATVDRIVASGWLQPDPELVTATIVAETGVNHACVVAEYLVDLRGPESGPETYFSYTTKNQFDRYIAHRLLKLNRIAKGGDLHDDWHSLQNRQEDYVHENVQYPPGLDQSKIYGVAKPHRYWPAQLLRYLEAIRLDKISEDEKYAFKVGKTDLKAYAIPWNEFTRIMKSARSVDDICVGVAIRVMEVLTYNGLSDEQILEVIVRGYSPGGPVSEHGRIPMVGQLWKSLLKKVQSNPAIGHLSEPLTHLVSQKMQTIGYPW